MGSVADGKVALIVGVTKDLTSRVQAGKISCRGGEESGRLRRRTSRHGRGWRQRPGGTDDALAESYAVVEGLLK